MTTSTHPLRSAIGTSHRMGGRARQQDALLATPGLVAVADGFGERADLATAVLAAFESGGLADAVAVVASDIADSLPDAPTSGTTLTAVRVTGSHGLGDARRRRTRVAGARPRGSTGSRTTTRWWRGCSRAVS